MEQHSIYRYYAFGFNYCLVKNKGLDGLIAKDAHRAISTVLPSLEALDLQVTKKVAEDLYKLRDEFAEKEGEVVSATQAERFRAAIDRMDPTLDAELKLRTAYILTKKRYALSSLTSAPEELLGQGTWESLTDTSRRDLSLACTQIALSQPTGAAFHLMRALEEQVKVLYYAYKKINRLTKPMWGPMTTELRAKRNPRPSEKLLDHLDGMRVHFRNPTQHPDSFYTLDEAQDLLSQTIAAIGMICSELPQRAAKKAAGVRV